MTDTTAQFSKQQLAGLAGGRERTIRVAIRARVHPIERVDISRERIELGALAGFRLAERRTSLVDVVRQEPETVEHLADLMLQVLHFVEIAGPVQAALALPRAPQERDGVAQAFARRAEVVDATIVQAFEVTRAAGDVAFESHARVLRVVKDPFSLQHLGWQLFALHGRDLTQQWGCRLVIVVEQ